MTYLYVILIILINSQCLDLSSHLLNLRNSTRWDAHTTILNSLKAGAFPVLGSYSQDSANPDAAPPSYTRPLSFILVPFAIT